MTAALRLAALGLVALTPPALADNGFDVVTLGARGGLEGGNLSAFLIQPHGDPRAVTCDAGAIVNGIRVAEEKGAFDAVELPAESDYTRVGHVFTDVIRGYFISHSHLDHIAGLIVGSPDDSAKPIYGLPSVLGNIESTYFNWVAWPNFGKSGTEPHLGKYDYIALAPGEPVEVANTAITATAFPLSHGGVESTAFLFESGGDSILCFGDTGPDSVEGGEHLATIWQTVAEQAKSGALKAIVIESSYTSDRPDNLLFGHLTPKHILAELGKLADLAGGPQALAGLPVVISHIKYQIKQGELPQVTILNELEAGNDLGVRFIIPEQGMSWHFDARD